MAVLPDLAAAGVYAFVSFLLALGILVVFVETIPARLLAGLLVFVAVLALGLAGAGEAGIAFLVLGVGAALVANAMFERLTIRG